MSRTHEKIGRAESIEKDFVWFGFSVVLFRRILGERG